jgi:hypothetical protein
LHNNIIVKLTLFKDFLTQSFIENHPQKQIMLTRSKENQDISIIKGHADGVIRIPVQEYPHLKIGEKLTHFNLEVSFHKPKKKYLLAKITKHGFCKKDGTEVQPTLDFKECLIGECTSVKERVPYENITEDDFKDSMPHIKNSTELKEAILKRYKQSLPDHTEEELLSAGVSITTLTIINSFSQ